MERMVLNSNGILFLIREEEAALAIGFVRSWQGGDLVGTFNRTLWTTRKRVVFFVWLVL